MKQILCFGDSNTWGYNPSNGSRFPWDTRWTGITQDNLASEGIRIVEEGLCGRTTVFEDPLRNGRSGISLLPVLLETHKPDALVIMLGTNDCKTIYGVSAEVIAKGIDRLVVAAKNYNKDLKILVVSPIHLGDGVGEEGFDPEFNETSVNASHNLANAYKAVTNKYDLAFLDASLIAKSSDTDREHMDEKNHSLFADVITKKIKELIS